MLRLTELVAAAPVLARGLLGPNVFSVESFSPGILQRTPIRNTISVFASTIDRGDESIAGDIRLTSPSSKNDTATQESADIDVSNISEAQLLLACRAYLLRKHKVEWKQKKRRAEASASPLNNDGYFWPDPNDLLYLREDPDPYNLIYNETYGEYYGYKRNGVRLLASQDTTYSGKNYLNDESVQPEDERASTSTNPFSTNPLYPSDEHVRRSNAKLRLFNNETWKEEWYKRRWGGKVASESQKVRGKQEKLIREMPNDVLESPSFDNMSEEEVAEAIITYLASNKRKSESRKGIKDKVRRKRESFRKWRENVKQSARDSNEGVAHNHAPESVDGALSFSPSVEKMKEVRAHRSDKARRAFQTRLANSKANVSSSSSNNFTKLRRGYNQETNDIDNDGSSVHNDEEGDVSPMQAILHIDMALDHKKTPSPVDVEIILRPGRLGRRRSTLRRILSECFDLRGKCVPPLAGDSEDLRFVTKCTIEELGVFVLAKLRNEASQSC
ncbi:hypothetical protein ACHAWF_010853 [Thalassiosira exigua]